MLIFTNPPLRSFSSSHFEYYISFQYGIDVPSASFLGPSAYFLGPPSCSSAHKPFPEVFRSPLPESTPSYFVPSPFGETHLSPFQAEPGETATMWYDLSIYHLR